MAPPTRLLDLQGPELSAQVFSDGSIHLQDLLPGGRVWKTWPVAIQEDNEIDVGHVWQRTGRSLCEQYPGRFTARRLGAASLRLTLIGRENLPAGEFTATYTLAGGGLCVTVSDIDESLLSLSYPAGFADADELILPQGVGKRITKGSDDRKYLTFWAHLNLRMWGSLRYASPDHPQDGRPDHGLLAEFTSGHEDAGLMLTRKIAQPVFLKSLGKWENRPRRITYRFTRGGYVGLARAYRQTLQRRGTLVTLKEKLARHPQLANLLGGRAVSFMLGRTHRADRQIESLRNLAPTQPDGLHVDMTYADVARVLDELQSNGLGKALVLIRGWIPGGYDESHPDVWPPDPAFGTLDQLKALCNRSPNLTTALHDNYQDIYLQSPSWPRGVIRDRQGRAMQGGYWAGGQAYILNSRDGLAYLQRNWAQLQTLGFKAFFPDTTTAVQLYQSFEPGNTATRAQDEQYKLDLLKFIDERVLVGSEESSEFGLAHVAWLENRHHRVAGESVPLWPLVVHDCVANARYGNAYFADSDTPPPGSVAPSGWRLELLWGYYALMSLGTWGENSAKVVRALRESAVVDEFFAKVSMAEMTDHRYLTPDGQVEQTTFSTGHQVTVNFSAEGFTGAGLSLAPHAWKIAT